MNSAGPFAPIALGVANTGSYAWTVARPTTAPRLAFLRVRAHDANANLGVDVSDSGFTITDPSTGVAPRPRVSGLTAVGPNPAARTVQIQFSLASES